MTAENFCYWLQGFFEITGKVESLSKEQVEMIQRHLLLVFNNVTGKQVTKEEQKRIGDLLDQLMKGGSVDVQTCSAEPKKTETRRKPIIDRWGRDSKVMC